MMPGITNAKIVGFISTFLLLLLSYVLLFTYTHQLMNQSVTVDHTNRVINNLEYLVSQIKEAEYNYHGFIATKDDEFAGNFKLSSRRTDSLYQLIRTLTANSQEHSARLDTIHRDLSLKLSTLNSGLVKIMDAPDPNKIRDSLYTLEYAGKTRGNIRKQIRMMQFTEEAYLKLRTAEMNRFSSLIKIINFFSLFLAFVLAILSFITYRREKKAGMESYRKSELYKNQLESRVNELDVANKQIKELKNSEKFASTGRIARTIAHEVRNPLTNINLATEQLKDSITENSESSMLLEMVKRNSLRINQLISNLLNATKFSELSYQKSSLNDLLDSALEDAADRINLKHIRVEKDYSPNICNITLDQDKMKIAFLNIIVNAIEAMPPENPMLKITTVDESSYCRVVFADNGIGMNEEILTKLFEPFFSNKDNGNGLGLTNTQNIILNHRGKIEVESEEGKGTKFIITLDKT